MHAGGGWRGWRGSGDRNGGDEGTQERRRAQIYTTNYTTPFPLIGCARSPGPFLYSYYFSTGV